MKILCFVGSVLILLLFISSSNGQQQGRRSKSDSPNRSSTSNSTSSPLISQNVTKSTAVSPSASGSALILNLIALVRESLTTATSILVYQARGYAKVLNELWSQVAKNELLNSPIFMSIVGVAFIGLASVASAYAFPELEKMKNDKSPLKKLGRIGRSIGEIAQNMDKAIDTYSTLEPEICMMMALCTLGSAQQLNTLKRRSRTIETINTVLTFPGIDEIVLVRKDFRESHAFGRNGGNCELINVESKCPFNYETWKLLLSSLSSVI